MAKIKKTIPYHTDGTINLTVWLEKINLTYQIDTKKLALACTLAQQFTEKAEPLYDQSPLAHGLKVAETILQLKLDQETAIAGLLSSSVLLTPAIQDTIKKELGDPISKLIQGTQLLMARVPLLRAQANHNKAQIDKLRKMLLAMATDIRVVIIKLAERLCMLQQMKHLSMNDVYKLEIKDILDIYAPLANRLGMGQLKWELEDLAFRYLDPDAYKTIAAFLSEHRDAREQRVKKLIHTLQIQLAATHLQANITGRAKHIYSIYNKAVQKELNYQTIYDQIAVRILVPSIEDCYTTLSIVHGLWQPVMEEFDDYIAHPKPNGYRSIHTTLLDNNGKPFEIQIRTHALHEEAEHGIAAHWLYKEKNKADTDHHDMKKMSYLRQLIAWHTDIAQSNQITQNVPITFDDQVYLITPAGEILDLPIGSTPLDFAYRIHSEMGHRCRGAKINGHIVPLTHVLQSGDKIEIITAPQGQSGPSRDWLNAELGYIKTASARKKIALWFRELTYADDVIAGRQTLERELIRLGITKTIALSTIARQLHFKNEDDLLAALNHGRIKLMRLMQLIHPKRVEKSPVVVQQITAKTVTPSRENLIGNADLLTRLAQCCKPVVGDDIVGYISRRGLAIHKKNCVNLQHLSKERFIPIYWNADEKK